MAAATYVSLLSGDPTTLAFQRFPGAATERGAFRFARSRLAWTLLTALITIIVTGFAFDRLSWALGLGGWAAGLASMRFTSTAWLMWHAPWRYAANLATSTLSRTAVLVLGIHLGMEPAIALGASGAISMVIAITFGPRADASVPRHRPWPRRLGLTLMVASLGFTLLQTFDKMLVPMLISTYAAGIYAAMYQTVAVSLG
ncbi:hypothetical protein PU560_08945, partial [Georgenia sp. 10Sc9-8]|nr:hypothetical protein [Georgenia halotolerans]